MNDDFQVTTRIFNGNIAQHTNWDYTSQITYYDEQFENIVASEDLRIGFPVNFTTSWDVKFVDGFPVRFYTDRCAVVSDSTHNEYAIIKNGCGSVLTNTQLHSPDPYQPYYIRYSFRYVPKLVDPI